jgi:hypothetical protein
MRPLAQFVLAVAACLLLSTTAHARTIDACVMKNGILKVLDEGAECLPQETPITLGQAQAAVESVRVFDGEGRDIGAFLDQQNGVVRVLLADLGVIARINTAGISPRHPLNGHPDIIFGLAGCDGPGYVGAYWSNTLFPSPQSRDVWLVGATDQQWAIRAASILKPDGSCEEVDLPPRQIPSSLVVPVEEFTQELGDTFSRPLPLWIGSSSSVSP